LPVIVLPQHLFAEYGGLGRDRYFLVVCIAHLVPLIRLCTLFQYWRDLAYDFFVVALCRFRVAIILFYIMQTHYIFSGLKFDTFCHLRILTIARWLRCSRSNVSI
jgi:hypothetical protein